MLNKTSLVYFLFILENICGHLRMAKLGSSKRPAVVRVQDQNRTQELLTICCKNGMAIALPKTSKEIIN